MEDQSELEESKVFQNKDNMALPASKLNEPIDFNTVTDENKDDFMKSRKEVLYQVQEIPNNYKAQAEILMTIFTEDTVK